MQLTCMSVCGGDFHAADVLASVWIAVCERELTSLLAYWESYYLSSGEPGCLLAGITVCELTSLLACWESYLSSDEPNCLLG